jgi:hypothetical protein
LALLYQDRKDYGKAEAEVEDAVNVARICLGDDHKYVETLQEELKSIKTAAARYNPPSGR